MFKSKHIIYLLFALFLVGCGYKQTNTQMRDTAYLKFHKSDFQVFDVHVNDIYSFKLEACTKNEETGQCVKEDKVYQVDSGNINIKVYNNNKELVYQKDMYIGSSNTMEVTLP